MKFVEAVRQAIFDSMQELPEMIVLGQGVWSPFYVGQSMDGIESEFGRDRVIDTPVSENAATGIALGSALLGNPTLVIHPRMDFMILAMDPIVNAAAKWRYALNWSGEIPLTIRAIINRGGEQGAQHSQSLQSWFAHIPGLRVVMPSSPRDAYYLLRQSIQCPDPVLFIEDRWSYSIRESFDVNETLKPLAEEGPKVVRVGTDITLVGLSQSTNDLLTAADELSDLGISAEVIDLRILNPMNTDLILHSLAKTGRLLVVDFAWRTASVSSEILARVSEEFSGPLLSKPRRINLPDSPAPTSVALENLYYPKISQIVATVQESLKDGIS